MCGIAGIVDFSGRSIDPATLVAMRDSMVHRGPDDYAAVLLPALGLSTQDSSGASHVFFRDPGEVRQEQLVHQGYSVGLAHRRLSILDLSPSGRQPMSNEDGQIWITYNGEIYNYQEIRGQLQAAGHRFRSRTDTEVIVHAYEEWGMECLKHFIGMFAFALWDGRRREIYLVRDRVGIKPLYYAIDGKTLYFASEIKAILQAQDASSRLDNESLYHYLSFHCVPAPRTLFEGISKLEPGHYAVIDHACGAKTCSYWDMFCRRTSESLKRTEQDISEELLELFQDATRLRMISDVPFGAFLSGGIDSSLNVAVMSQFLQQPVNTFTIGFDEAQGYNELSWAREVAAIFHTRHHERIIKPEEVVPFLPQLIYHQDEPIADTVCVPVYFVSKLAKDSGITVCQVGEGADELFCGYPSWLAALHRNKNRTNAGFLALQLPKLLASGLTAHLMDIGWGTYENLLAGFNGDIFWGGAVSYRDRQKKRLLHPSTFAHVNHLTQDLISQLRMDFGQKCFEPDQLTWMTYLDLRIRLPELLLMRLDKMNMSVSLEGRVPFLDHRLVEFAMSLGQAQKLRHPQTKYLLKKAIRGKLPDSIIDRNKQGFRLPVDPWYENYMKDEFLSHLNGFLADHDIFNRGVVKKLCMRKQVPWIIMNFILWHRMWIDRTYPQQSLRAGANA